MAAAAANTSIPDGRPCTSPSTITPAWPSLRSCPIRRPTPLSLFCAMPSTSSLATASPSAPCSPITAATIAPITFTKLACRWASNTAALALTRRKPTAKPNASSKPLCASGPTPPTGPTPTNATHASLPGPTTTTTLVLMVASTTSRPSAAPNQVQRLDHLQPPAGFSERPLGPAQGCGVHTGAGGRIGPRQTAHLGDLSQCGGMGPWHLWCRVGVSLLRRDR